MKKSFTYKAISLCLAFLVLVSSLGISLDMHFCKGVLKSVHVFGVAESCQIASKVQRNKSTCGEFLTSCTLQIAPKVPSLKKKTCCSNAQIDILTGDYFQKEFSSKLISLKVFKSALFMDDFGFEANTLRFQPIFGFLYRPPNLLKDIPVLVQSFLL